MHKLPSILTLQDPGVPMELRPPDQAGCQSSHLWGWGSLCSPKLQGLAGERPGGPSSTSEPPLSNDSAMKTALRIKAPCPASRVLILLRESRRSRWQKGCSDFPASRPSSHAPVPAQPHHKGPVPPPTNHTAEGNPMDL